MNPHYERAWRRLTSAARRVPDEGSDDAPFGFGVRVAALAMGADRPRLTAAERISLRAMVVAGVLAVAAIGANYSALARLFQDEAPPSDDPVAELIDIAS
jgi:hypothetical protein